VVDKSSQLKLSSKRQLVFDRRRPNRARSIHWFVLNFRFAHEITEKNRLNPALFDPHKVTGKRFEMLRMCKSSRFAKFCKSN
jgi:hypothetical protein